MKEVTSHWRAIKETSPRRRDGIRVQSRRGATRTARCFLQGMSFVITLAVLAAPAKAGKHFEGPYHVTIKPFDQAIPASSRDGCVHVSLSRPGGS
jgi:hypothetical protein